MRLRRRRWNEKKLAEWRAEDAADAFVLGFVGTADNHPGEYMAPDEIRRAGLVFRVAYATRGDRYFAWHYEESLGAVHAIHKVRCSAYGVLDKALNDARTWAKEHLTRTDEFAAVPNFVDLPSGTRQVCLYTFHAIPSPTRRGFIELWDWERDDVARTVLDADGE